MEKDIYLPHIHYKILVRPFKKDARVPNALAYTEHNKNGVCTLYLPKGKQMPGDIAHELVHVLQFICLDRDIRFEVEQEHMGYIMHYLMGQVFGHTF